MTAETDSTNDRTDDGGDRVILKERQTPQGLLVAVCDSDVLGETFEEGEVSLTVTEEFYGSEEVDEETVVDSLSRATVANVVGTESVRLAIETGVVDEANVLEIESTPHAQMVRLF